MQRIVTRFFGLLVCGVFAGGFISACASDSSPVMTNAALQHHDGGAPKYCTPAYCMATPPATACCLNAATCGVNYGQGCVPASKDAGAH
jgi:hypothetical protein